MGPGGGGGRRWRRAWEAPSRSSTRRSGPPFANPRWRSTRRPARASSRSASRPVAPRSTSTGRTRTSLTYNGLFPGPLDPRPRRRAAAGQLPQRPAERRRRSTSSVTRCGSRTSTRTACTSRPSINMNGTYGDYMLVMAAPGRDARPTSTTSRCTRRATSTSTTRTSTARSPTRCGAGMAAPLVVEDEVAALAPLRREDPGAQGHHARRLGARRRTPRACSTCTGSRATPSWSTAR